jgi:hypothetical protein
MHSFKQSVRKLKQHLLMGDDRSFHKALKLETVNWLPEHQQS